MCFRNMLTIDHSGDDGGLKSGQLIPSHISDTGPTQEFHPCPS